MGRVGVGLTGWHFKGKFNFPSLSLLQMETPSYQEPLPPSLPTFPTKAVEGTVGEEAPPFSSLGQLRN